MIYRGAALMTFLFTKQFRNLLRYDKLQMQMVIVNLDRRNEVRIQPRKGYYCVLSKDPAQVPKITMFPTSYLNILSNGYPVVTSSFPFIYPDVLGSPMRWDLY